MKNVFTKNPAITVVMVFLLILILISLIYLIFLNQPQKLEANTKLGELNLSDLRIEAAKETITERAEKINDQGLIFTYQNKNLNIPAKVIAFDSEMSYEIFSIEVENSLTKVLDKQTKNVFFKLFPQLKKQELKIIEADFRFHQERFQQTLNKLFADYEIKSANAHFDFNQDDQLIIVPEIIGKKINQTANLNQAKNKLANLSLEKIPLIIDEIQPEIYSSNLIGYQEMIIELVTDNEFLLTYQSEVWPLEKKDLVTWIMINEKQEIVLNKEKIKNYLLTNLAPQIDRLAKLPSFTIEEGKIKNWQAGKSGRKLIIETSTDKIAALLLAPENKVELIVEETMGEEAKGLAKEIVEIIGTGHSNFAGSPYNRVHNIRVGAEVYHGLIIAPGEEFSTLANLGPVNASTGYLPELVIRDNQTIPEYGGGLCQISTTLFRTALQSGLPITARQAHSFRVSYYEPAGTDASIYNPWPDLKFINDTDHHILIQARIEGADLYFDFWGTNDGRQVEKTRPVIYNIVAPPPTKYIDSQDLKPGEKKCTENAHNGANTYFDYTVIYPDGEKVEERFHSYYVPWQEVCLIGLEEEEEETETEKEAKEIDKEND